MKHVVKYHVELDILLCIYVFKYWLLRSGHQIQNGIFGPGPIGTRDAGPGDLGPGDLGSWGPGDPGPRGPASPGTRIGTWALEPGPGRARPRNPGTWTQGPWRPSTGSQGAAGELFPQAA